LRANCPDGTPITTSDYTIDLTRGAVVSTSRVVGLSGAATSLAQGVEGGLQNPAAVAYRGHQWPEWYDYWLALGVTYPFDAGDFYNSGRAAGNNRWRVAAAIDLARAYGAISFGIGGWY